MFKLSSKILLICALLAGQSNFVTAGDGAIGPSQEGLIIGAAAIGLVGAGVGIAGFWGLNKSYKWAKQEKGPKKYIGCGIVATAGIAAIFGLGCGLGYGIAKLR